jgi:glycosyltransferase involved in cell wall biosynthesis
MSVNNTEHTFVILAYKESVYLEDCIKSVLNQTVYSNVIIATSTPNQFIDAAAAKYNLPVKVNSNGGSIGRDWNFGLACAETPYVTLAHQDDTYMPRFAELCLAAVTSNKSSHPLIAFTRSVTYRGNKPLSISYKNMLRWLLIFPFHFRRCIASENTKRFILLFSNSISCPGVFYVKQNLSGFTFDENQKYTLDWKAWFEMSQMQGAFIYIPTVLHTHREHEESATSSIQIEALRHEELNLLTAIWGNRFIPRIITKLLLVAK